MGKHNKVVDFINHFFENINVYRSVLLYDDVTFKRMYGIRKKLESHNFSTHLISETTLKEDYINHRMFICHVGTFEEFKIKIDIESLNVIFCLNHKIYKNVLGKTPHGDNVFLLKV